MAKAAALLKGMAKKQQPEKKKKDEHPVLQLEPTKENIECVLEWIRGKRQETQGEAIRKQQEETLLPVMEPARLNWCLEHGEFHSNVKFSVDLTEYKKQLLAAAKTPEEKAEVERMSDEHILSLTVQNRYSEIPLDNEEKLHGIVKSVYELKEDEEVVSQFDRLFKTETKIEVSNAGKQQIETLLPRVMEAVAFTDAERDEYRKLSSVKKKTPAQEKRLEELTTQLQEKFALYFTVKQFYTPSEAFHEGSVTDTKMSSVMKKAKEDGLVKPTKPSLRNQ